MNKEEYQNFKTKYSEVAELLDEVAEVRKTIVGIDQEAIGRRWEDAPKRAWYQELLQYDAFLASLDCYELQALEKWEAFARNSYDSSISWREFNKAYRAADHSAMDGDRLDIYKIVC